MHAASACWEHLEAAPLCPQQEQISTHHWVWIPDGRKQQACSRLKSKEVVQSQLHCHSASLPHMHFPKQQRQQRRGTAKGSQATARATLGHSPAAGRNHFNAEPVQQPTQQQPQQRSAG